MSLPETCPFCGAGVLVMEDGKECRSGVWVTFDCHTSLQTVADPRRFQSSECEVRERLHLAARVAELEVENKTLRDRFSDADTERNAAQAALKAAFIRVAELEARVKRMQEIGDMIVDEYLVERAERDAWQQAKEARP